MAITDYQWYTTRTTGNTTATSNTHYGAYLADGEVRYFTPQLPINPITFNYMDYFRKLEKNPNLISDDAPDMDAE